MSALPCFEYFVGIHHRQFTLSDFLSFFGETFSIPYGWICESLRPLLFHYHLSLAVVLRSLDEHGSALG